MNDHDEASLVERLRAGDEGAFEHVFELYQPVLFRLVLAFVKTPSLAEEVVQDAWVAAIAKLNEFEGRSTFKTWIARIAINGAKTRATREGRNVPLAFEGEDATAEPAVDPCRFLSTGLWNTNTLPSRWNETPEALVERREVREVIERALEALPPAQRVVVTMRDLDGFTSEEACNALGVSESNQRVLLHRGRSRLRAVLEQVLGRNAP